MVVSSQVLVPKVVKGIIENDVRVRAPIAERVDRNSSYATGWPGDILNRDLFPC